MPNRVLKDYTESEAMNRLSWAAEAFFIRLIIKADENGVFAGNELLLKSRLYPLKNGVRVADISRWIAECEKAGLIRVCESKGTPFLQVAKNAQRQRISRKNDIPRQVAASCGELRQSAAHDGTYPHTSVCEYQDKEIEKKSVYNTLQKEKENFVLNHPKKPAEVIAEAEKRSVRITEEKAMDFIRFFEATAQGDTWVIHGVPVRDWRKLMNSRWIENWKSEKRKGDVIKNECDYSKYGV